METLYRVIYTGRLQPGADRDRFVALFSKQFGVSEAQALQLSDAGKEVVIKKNAPRDRAQQYQGVLEGMGMVVRLETMDGKPLGASGSSSPSRSGSGRSCPKCGSRNIDAERDECRDCGVLISRYSAPPAGDTNPYAAPAAALYQEADDTEMTGPVTVPAGHGWRWFTRGFWHFRQNIGGWLGAILVWIVLSVVLQFIPLLGSLVLLLISPVLTAGFMLGSQEQEDGGDFELRHLFAGFSTNVGQLMLVGLLYMLGMILIGVVMAVLLGGMMTSLFMGGMMMEGGAEPDMSGMYGTIILMVLIGVGASVPLMMAYWFAPALVALEDMSAVAAMRSSFMACLKNILPFLVFGLVAMLLMFVAAIPLMLGFFVLFPVIIAAIYVGYRDIYYGPTEFD